MWIEVPVLPGTCVSFVLRLELEYANALNYIVPRLCITRWLI